VRCAEIYIKPTLHYINSFKHNCAIYVECGANQCGKVKKVNFEIYIADRKATTCI